MSLGRLTIGECAKSMGCSKRTVYRRFRALEKRLGRPVLGTKASRGREFLAVRRSDLERAMRLAGIEPENHDITEIKDTLEMVCDALERLIVEVRKR